jgi:hypothetical protein
MDEPFGADALLADALAFCGAGFCGAFFVPIWLYDPVNR